MVAVAYDYVDDDEVDDADFDQASDIANSVTNEQDLTKINAAGVKCAKVKTDVNYVISRGDSASSGTGTKMNNLMENQSNNTWSPPSSYSKFNPILKSIQNATTATNQNDGGAGDAYPPPSSAELEGDVKASFRKGSGGGGGGRYRCPKCGTDVTFKCDFEDNTFYCATCAGWFAGRSSPIDATTQSNVRQQGRDDRGIYEEFIAKDMRNTQHRGPGGDQEIIMRHVSTTRI